MFKRFLAMLIAVALGGCSTPSVHTIYSKDKEVAEPALVGTWRGTDAGDKPTYAVSRAGDGYLLHVKNNEPQNPEEWDFDVQLVQLGAGRFADVAATEAERGKHDDHWGPFFLPTHLIARYTVEGDSLTVWMLNAEALKSALDDHSVTLAHTWPSKDTLLLTAETPDLQKFLGAHVKDEGLFNKAVLQRVKP
jgi:hypothetical protein